MTAPTRSSSAPASPGCALRATSPTRGARCSCSRRRDRPGGRTWTRPFAGSGEAVEVGGSWFTPEHLEVPYELVRYGLETRTYDAPAARALAHRGRAPRWTAGALRRARRARGGARRDRGRRRRAARPGRSARGPRSRARTTCASSAAPPATREFLVAWWVMIGGTHPERGAVVDALAAIASHGGCDGPADDAAPRAGRGLERARRAHGGERGRGGALRSGAALRPPGRATAVELGLADGSTRRRAARGARAARQHAPGRALRAAASRRDRRGARHQRRPCAQALAARPRRAAGRARRGARGGSALALRRPRPRGGDVLLLGFGYEDDAFDPADRGDVERALRAVLPAGRSRRVRSPRLERRSFRARHVGDRAGRAGASC